MSDLIQRLKDAAAIDANTTKELLEQAVERIVAINQSYDLLCIEYGRYGEALRAIQGGATDPAKIAQQALEPVAP